VKMAAANDTSADHFDSSEINPAKIDENNIEGVKFSGSKWIAQIEVQGKQRFVGKFDSYDAAMSAFVSAKSTQENEVNDPQVPSKPMNDTSMTVISIEADVAEALRNMVCHVDWTETRPTPPATYSKPSSTDSARLCRFGSKCERTDIYHWTEATHPDDHPRMGTPALPLPEFKLDTMIDCHHWRQKVSLQITYISKLLSKVYKSKLKQSGYYCAS
jgi:hypothetical protein